MQIKMKRWLIEKKKWFISVLGFGAVAVFGATAPIVDTEIPWAGVSYESVAFMTADGDLGMNEYAIKEFDQEDENGDPYILTNYIYRDTPKETTRLKETLDFGIVEKMKLVEHNFDGRICYIEYQEYKGQSRFQVPCEDYKKLTLKNPDKPFRIVKASLLDPIRASAAISYSTSTDHGLFAGVTEVVVEHTITGSSNFLATGFFDGYQADKITSVTYNAVAMARADEVQTPSDRFIYIYYLTAPATGANNIVYTMSSSDALRPLSASYTGVHQIQNEVIEDFNSQSASSGSTADDTVTSISDNNWSMMFVKTISVSIAAGAGTTKRTPPEGAEVAWMDGNGPVTPAGAQTLESDFTSSNHGDVIISVREAADNSTIVTDAINEYDFSITSTTIEMLATLTINNATTSWMWFVYDSLVADPYSATTTASTTATNASLISTTTDLTVFSTYNFEGRATSTPDGGILFALGGNIQAFTADGVTSTPSAVFAGWSGFSNFDQGTLTNLTGGATLTLTDSGGGAKSTTTDSFESVTDNSTDFSSTLLWKQASVTTDGGDWEGETGTTVSSGTGATDGSDGTVFIYTEASAGAQCASVNTVCTIEADIADGVDGAIAFDYWYEGAGLSDFTLDGYNGSTWENLGFTKDGTTEGTGWTAAYYEWSASDGYEVLRFHAPTPSTFSSDISLDFIRVGTSSPSFSTTGEYISASWDVGSFADVDSTYMITASTVPALTNVYLLTAVNSSASVAPLASEYATSTGVDGETIPGISVGDDLTGKYLWVKIKLATTDTGVTPTLTSYGFAINDGANDAAPPAADDAPFPAGIMLWNGIRIYKRKKFN